MPFTLLQNGAYYSDCAVKAETLVDDWLIQADFLQDWTEKKVADYV